MDRTPPQSAPKPVLTDITPVGDHDPKPKIQLCIEWRNKEIKTKSKSNKKVQQVLEVTVMWAKNLPKRSCTFVKLTLLPDDNMQTTQLQANKKDAQYIEVFSFPLKLKSNDLREHSLQVQVCENKATRNAKIFGSVVIPVGHLKLGQSITDWYHLQGLNHTKDDKTSDATATTTTKRNAKIKRSKNQRDKAAVEKEEVEKLKEEDENAFIIKTNTNFRPIYN